MISSGLKKLGEQKGFKEEKNCVHGIQDGYYLSISETENLKRLTVGVTLADNDERRKQIEEYISNNSKEMGIQSASIRPGYLDILFQNQFGIMDKLAARADALTTFLKQLAIPGAETCWYCGNALTGTGDKAVIEGAVVTMHGGCIESFSRRLDEAKDAFKNQNKKYGMGAVGALIGGLVGTIPWVIIYVLGYIAGLAGLVIGFGAKFGYEKLGGKPGKLKPWIVVLAIIVCVLIGTFAGLCFSVAKEFEASVFEVVPFVLEVIGEPEIFGPMIKDLLIGLAFAIAASYGIFKETRLENKGGVPDVKRLES